MGFVYNNVWEAFCKTYLELNGFFVLTNTFVALMDEDEPDRRRRTLEADVVAYKLQATDLGDYFVDVPPNAAEREEPAEFFAGVNDAGKLVYCEVKANLSRDQRMITHLLDDNNVGRKAGRIEQRFKVDPTIVVMAYQINPENKRRIAQAGWAHKEFPSMLRFIRERFEMHRIAKRSVQYNDPWLEMMRLFSALELHGADAPPE
ncbi:MAG: hypothetical protein IMY80_05325 [Chloroflexi bacterium]|nr:hypothetical protein [Chloroflexota bacterium]